GGARCPQRAGLTADARRTARWGQRAPPRTLCRRNRLLELVPHRLDAGDLFHQVRVPRVEELHERTLLPADEDREDVAVVAGRCDGRVVAAVDDEGVAMPRHDRDGLLAVFAVAHLGAKPGLRPEAVVINLLELRFLWRPLGVVLVRRVAGPAALVGVQFAHEQAAGATARVLAEDVENPPVGVLLARADVDHLDVLRRNPERRERLRADAARDRDLGAVAQRAHGHARAGAAVDRIGRPVPDVGAAPDVLELLRARGDVGAA